MYHRKIADWPEEDRPREKMLKLGADALTDAELLAIILRVGGVQMTAVDLARQILQQCGGFRGLDRLTIQEMIRVQGIGPAKAAQIKAALEIGKRFAEQQRESGERIRSSEDVFRLYHLKFRDRQREAFCVIFLTSRNRIIDDKILFEGTLTESLVSPREVIREILNTGAAAVILLHNHPSGEVTPSPQDIKLTRALKAACNTIDVAVLDHIIIGDNRYYSFADEEQL
ncbi:MAG: DNA repair protein RadC [candidate division KSB1 bacterium]|nr:DNA repair protein RadC [candidate division KSB1 bacterium]MDQ7066420.1 DNA repair protein RadC [candidate division KSB1 bacterium]